MLRLVLRDLASVVRHRREHGLRATLGWLRSRDSPTTFQFAKYVLFGGVTTLVHLALFAVLTHTVLPAHDYLPGGALAPELKQRHAILSNLLAFPLAAAVNYLFNLRFVFTPGRHTQAREFGLFVGIALLSFGAGLLCGPLLISRGLDPWIAQAGLTVGSALVNYFSRKFWVFLR